jgi:hypothetical protein
MMLAVAIPATVVATACSSVRQEADDAGQGESLLEESGESGEKEDVSRLRAPNPVKHFPLLRSKVPFPVDAG